MKNLKNKKYFIGAASVLAILILALIAIPAPDEEALMPAGDIQTGDETELEALTAPEAERTNADETEPEEVALTNTEDSEASPEAAQLPSTPSSPTTPSAPENPEVVEVTLASVETLTEDVINLIEEHDIQYVETPQITQQEAPPPGMPEDAQGTDSNGNYIKVEDGERFIWDNVLGWGRDNGRGTVTIMDAQTSGYKFFIEPCGTVNLSKLIAPDGSIISYEEYQRIRESR
jgi:hypothetical protein